MADWGERPAGDSGRRGRRARPAVDDDYGAAPYGYDPEPVHDPYGDLASRRSPGSYDSGSYAAEPAEDFGAPWSYGSADRGSAHRNDPPSPGRYDMPVPPPPPPWHDVRLEQPAPPYPSRTESRYDPRDPYDAPPRYDAPPQPRYDAPSQPRYDAPVPPLYDAPVPPLYDAPVQSRYDAPVHPGYEAPPQPRHDETARIDLRAEPRYDAPAQPQMPHAFEQSGLFRPQSPPQLDVPLRPRPVEPPEHFYRSAPPEEPAPSREILYEEEPRRTVGRGRATPPDDADADAELTPRRSRSRGSAAPDARSRTAARSVVVEHDDDAPAGPGALAALPGSLQLRVVLATAGLVCVLASLLSFDQARALSSASNLVAEKELTAIARTFANGLVAGGIVEPEEITEHAQQLMQQQQIDTVHVYDVDPTPKKESVNLVASTGGPEAAGRLAKDERLTMLAGSKRYQAGPCTAPPLPDQGSVCGRAIAASPSGSEQPSIGVAIERNLTEAQQTLARRERRAAVGVAAMTGLVGFGLAWMLRHWIFFPMRRLQLVLRSAADGGGGARRLEWHSDDEIGALAAEVDTLADRMAQSQKAISTLALEDPHTGLPNRRAGMLQLSGEVAAAQRDEKPLAVVVFEADGLSAVGERYGQEALEDTLRKFGDAVRLSLRPSDVCAHLTGDRFLLVLRGSDARSAHTALDRIREVTTRVRVGPSGGLRLTAGVVESWAGGDPEELVSRAEEELEVSRRRGAAY